MGRFSGMEISSSPGLKNPQKLAQGRKILSSQGPYGRSPIVINKLLFIIMHIFFSIQRFCSSRDWGDYCEYIQRPGDPREYRSCVFTCTGHGCNGSNSLHKASSMAFLLALCMSLISKYF